MKILLVYPGTHHSTIDVALGYHEAFQELCLTVHPYYFHDYLDYHAGALAYWQEHNPDFQASDRLCGLLASEPLIVHVVEHQPDVILIVSGLSLHPRAYELLKRMDIPVAMILTECPYIDEAQMRMLISSGAKLAFVNEKNSARPMAEQTGIRTLYLPHSFSHVRHKPGHAPPVYETDIFFHGTSWPERRELFGQLTQNGYKIRIVGAGFDDDGNIVSIAGNHELIRWYRGCKIALNHHRTMTEPGAAPILTGSAWSLGPRAYEIAACGAFQLCDDTRPELFEIFGNSVATYRDARDLQRQVDYYMSHEMERMSMAAKARELAADCRFVDRAREIVVPALESL